MKLGITWKKDHEKRAQGNRARILGHVKAASMAEDLQESYATMLEYHALWVVDMLMMLKVEQKTHTIYKVIIIWNIYYKATDMHMCRGFMPYNMAQRCMIRTDKLDVRINQLINQISVLDNNFYSCSFWILLGSREWLRG